MTRLRLWRGRRPSLTRILLAVSLLFPKGPLALSEVAPYDPSTLPSMSPTVSAPPSTPAAAPSSFPQAASPLPESASPRLPSLPLLKYCGFSSDPITLNLRWAPIREVLSLFSRKSGINLIPSPEVEGSVTITLEEVPLDEALQTVLQMKGLAALPEGSRVVRVVPMAEAARYEARQSLVTETLHLRFARAEEIKPQLDALRSAAARRGNTVVNRATNSVVVTDTRLGILEARHVLSELDRHPIQISIEARIVEISNLDSSDFGVQWGAASSITGDAVRVDLGASDSPSGTAGSGTVAPGERLPILGGQAALSAAPGLGVGLNAAAETQGILSVGVIGNSARLSLILNALARKNKVRVLSSPQILTLDNQEASILVGSQIPYAVTTVSPGVGQTQSFQFVDVGVKLNVTPMVNEGGRVTLRVRPEVSTARVFAAGIPPTINTRKADTTVIVHNGETMVIGGLITDDERRLSSGVPFMRRLPIIGHLFKSTGKAKDRTELVVFLTPRIVEERLAGGTRVYDVPAQSPETAFPFEEKR